MTTSTDRAPARAEPARSKAALLAALIRSPQLEFLMEAHDGLSAKIVEQSGFDAIWASGLAISTALGVRDSNEASWTQVLEVLEFMADATRIPILVDGDTGYGNFNNLRRVVRKLCQRGIAGICIEDKLFPKTNSFIGEGQPLADIDEFCGKIKAGKDSQTDPDFQIVARVEALISGWGMAEALRRAEAYREAGADAILIHSKQRTADEVLEFTREWAGRSPVVVVPTKYYSTPTDAFREAGISVAIWANHNLRAALTAMQDVCRQIHREQSLGGVEGRIAGVDDVFELAGNAELAAAERRYLPTGERAPRAVVLAASRGSGLGELTADRPKCMLDVRGRPLLDRLVETLRAGGLRDITVVRGYRKHTVDIASIRTVDNDLHAQTGEAASLACAAEALEGPCVISYGDVLYRQYILERLLQCEGEIVLGVDARWDERSSTDADWVRDHVACDRGFSDDFLDERPVHATAIGHALDEATVSGEWIGLAKLGGEGARAVRELIAEWRDEGRLQRASMVDLLAELIARGHRPRVLYVAGHWLDVDNPADLEQARRFP